MPNATSNINRRTQAVARQQFMTNRAGMQRAAALQNRAARATAFYDQGGDRLTMMGDRLDRVADTLVESLRDTEGEMLSLMAEVKRARVQFMRAGRKRQMLLAQLAKIQRGMTRAAMARRELARRELMTSAVSRVAAVERANKMQNQFDVLRRVPYAVRRS